MKPNPDRSIALVIATLSSWRTALAAFVSTRLQERRRRIEQEKEFYRKLAAYCRANNLSVVCADDWKSAAYSRER